MSIFARTPESNAAWHQLKRNVALGLDAQRRSPREDEEGSRELRLLFAELKESPDPEAFDRFCALSIELAELAEQSLS